MPASISPGIPMRVLFLITALLSMGDLQAGEIDFTRFVGVSTPEDPIRKNTFFGTSGPARLIIGGSTAGAQITLNGESVPVQESDCETTVSLIQNNVITVVTKSDLSVRIKQKADIDLHVMSRVHFNTNVSDFASARAFYGLLGFETLSGFPDANTIPMAQAIGVETPTTYDGSKGGEAGGYLLHGELISIGGFGGGVIDLIEFTIPRDESPPYEAVNHLGMARATLTSSNVAADYARLSASGVTFIAPPTRRADGTLFVLFRDPDGTFYELAEVPGETDEDAPTHITGLGPLNINVSDFERSLAWYQMFGYELSRTLPSDESLEVAEAMGLKAPYRINGAVLTHTVDDSEIELVQWLDPVDTRPPYPIPINHLGIHRTAFATTDIVADVAALEAQGVKFISPITPCCDGPDSWGSIVAFYDPDGTIVELVEQPMMTVILRITSWFSSLFD